MTDPTKPTKPPEQRSVDERRQARSGETHWNLHDSEYGGRAPRQPNERDESADSQAASSATMAEQGQRAHQDAGGVDTDRGPVLEHLYDHTLRTGPGDVQDEIAPRVSDYGGQEVSPTSRTPKS